ncbi:glucosaminidase domain-containing protein [Candidimonas humi]|uniref:Glycoside hydrolase family 73 protein n=1 Tax=Candidimonas humi TaxID=683355 RepID=A0ABV8NXQ7_9BURK|nr:glucosaminidase domain-containing protein [Candidimonas humi]MBV6304951.1 glucosaminidase domain-containing protein [Candidimonas humi]
MTPADFIAAIAPAAQAAMRETKVPASVTIAQAALESGWGAHAPGHNLFGIKADASWIAPVTTKKTHEVVNGKTIIIEAKFRAYPDWLGSIEDHARFLVENPRYASAFEHCDDGEDFAWAIARAGYATDPDYASKLISIIRAHTLLALDTAGN